MDHITLQNHHHHHHNNNHFTLPQQHLNRPSPSASAPLSLLDFNPQDIDLYECLNSQHIPLSAPLSQSINPNNHLIDRLSFALEDDPSTIPSLPPVDQSHLISESSLFGLCPDPTRRRSYPSHTRLQAALPHNSVLTQSTSLPELPLGIDQPHSAPAAPTQPYPPALISIQTQPPSQNPLPRLDTIDSHPVSSRAVELDSNDNEPLSASHNSHTFDPIGLHALFLNRSSQAHSSNQLLLEPFLNAPISPLDHITPLAVSEKSIGTPDARSKSLEPKCNGIATSTLSQDFKKRKGWAKRLVEDIEDVLQLVSPSGKLLFLSESMSRLTGFSTSELLSLTLFDWCFEDEDRVNLKREINNCIRYGNPFSLYCRFKKKGSESFIILEMFGHLADIKSPEKATVAEEKENTQAVYMSGRLYPTSCGQLMDNFLEMMIENEMMARKLQCSEGGWLEEEEGEPEEGAQGEKNKWTVNELTKVVSIADEEESEDEHDQSTERSSHQIIGRDYPSRPRKRPKRDKVDFLCLDCGVTQSPEWRRGPMGRKTLCNACGLRYSKKGSVINSSTTADKK